MRYALSSTDMHKSCAVRRRLKSHTNTIQPAKYRQSSHAMNTSHRRIYAVACCLLLASAQFNLMRSPPPLCACVGLSLCCCYCCPPRHRRTHKHQIDNSVFCARSVPMENIMTHNIRLYYHIHMLILCVYVSIQYSRRICVLHEQYTTLLQTN